MSSVVKGIYFATPHPHPTPNLELCGGFRQVSKRMIKSLMPPVALLRIAYKLPGCPAPCLCGSGWVGLGRVGLSWVGLGWAASDLINTPPPACTGP